MSGHVRLGDRVMAEKVSVAEAAVRLGVSTDAIRKRLSRGTLEGDKVDGVWHVHIDTPPGAPVSGHDVEGAPVSGQAVDNGALATVIADLAKQNAQLSAAAAMWQERARGLEEKLMQLSSGPIAETDAPQSSVSDDPGTTGISTHVETPDAPVSAWARLWRAITGG